MQIRVFIIYRGFAHQKATKLIKNWFVTEFQCETVEISLNDNLDSVVQLTSAKKGDIIVMSCGGRDINNLFKKFNLKETITIALFPGILVNEQLDAFITRLSCSVVLLNSRKDELRYRKICKIFKVPFNGVLFGPAWFPPYIPQKFVSHDSKKKHVIFFEQTMVPFSNKDRKFLADELWELARKNGNILFSIKERKAEYTIKQLSISHFLNQKKVLENLRSVSNEVGELLAIGDIFISISSSALVEALVLGKNVHVLNDFKHIKHYSGFFKSSGLEVSFRLLNLENSKIPDSRWAYNNLYNPNDGLHNLGLKLKELSNAQNLNTYAITRPKLSTIWMHFPTCFGRHYKSTIRKINNAFNIIGI